jgi:L-asparagine oxygenase
MTGSSPLAVEYRLSSDESARIRAVAGALARKYTTTDDVGLVDELYMAARRLPDGPIRFLREFRMHEPAGACIVRGLAIDDRIGPTPARWRDRPVPNPALAEEIITLLYGAVLGEPFAWATQQDGRLVHDIFPMKEHRGDQLGFGSEVVLTWHTEDAFHPYRGDYLVLTCLRNPDGIPTTAARLDMSRLESASVRILLQERFLIGPDESHLPHNNDARLGELTPSFAEIEAMNAEPRAIAVLSGDPEDPYLRLDPYFMSVPDGDTEAQRAFDDICVAIDESMNEIRLQAGDTVVLDNFKSVHGRPAFVPRFDGTDRWLKRVNVTRDLRKSRAGRRSPGSCVVG